MAKYTTFSPLYNNTGLGAAAKNFQSTMFGGGGGGASEMDPSQIWANEQLAQQRKAKAALDQQLHGAQAQTLAMPGANSSWIKTNDPTKIEGALNSQIARGMMLDGTNLAPLVNQQNPSIGALLTGDRIQSEADYQTANWLGDYGSIPGSGEFAAYSPGQRANNITISNQAEMARTQADNARAIATNQADNVRALEQTGLTNENNILKALLAPVPASAQRFNPPGVVEQHGVDAIQATPAKPTTSGSGASAKGWMEGQSPMQVKNIQANWFNTGYRKKNPKFDGVENLPSGFFDNVMQDVYDVVQSGKMTVANATNAEMEKIFSDGFHQFQYDPPGMFNLNAFGVVPKKLFDFYAKEYGRKKREGKGDEGLSEIEDVFINLGYPEEAIAAILSDIQSK